MKTFNSKFPCEAPIEIATSLPKTWHVTIVTASAWVGFTFPGMIEEPGSFAGISNSPRPQRGPDANHLTSLAIFIISAASALRAPWEYTSASWEVSAWNLFGAVIKSWPVNSLIFLATLSPISGWALRPVPTAVPPSANSRTASRESLAIFSHLFNISTQPLISWPRVSGVASWRCVRPIFTTDSNLADFAVSVAFSFCIAGITFVSIAITAAMWSAVG